MFECLSKKSLALLAGAAAVLLACGACSQQKPATGQSPATAPVGAVAQVAVVETRLVEKTVVVTATPVPVAAYVSRTDLGAGTLGYPLADEPQTLDPQAATDEASRLAVAQLYEGLFSLDKDGDVVPAAASGYEASADGKTYTVTLRSGLQWSDGRPVTPQQYVDGFCRALDPALGNDLAQGAARRAGISGATAYAGGARGDCAAVGVHAVDEQHLRIDLENPAGALLQLLAYPAWLPAPRSQATRAASASADALDPASFIGNGPYLPATWQPGTRLTLVKNERYWDAAHVAIQRIDLQFVGQEAGQLALYEGGGLHVAGFPAAELPRIQAQLAFSQELQLLIQPGVSYLGMNTLAGPTADVNFRRAIASALDRRALVRDGLHQPWHVPALSLIPPGVAGYQADDDGQAYDPAAAQTFLAQAGYGPANPPPAIELWTSREGNNPALMATVGAMLEKAGIPTRLVTSSWEVYQSSLSACGEPKASAGCSYGLYWGGWVLDSDDPAILLSHVLGPGSSLQYTGWRSADYEDVLAEAVGERDADRRGELYRTAEKILLDDAVAVVPLLYYDRLQLIKHGVGYAYPPFGPPEFRNWTLP